MQKNNFPCDVAFLDRTKSARSRGFGEMLFTPNLNHLFHRLKNNSGLTNRCLRS